MKKIIILLCFFSFLLLTCCGNENTTNYNDIFADLKTSSFEMKVTKICTSSSNQDPSYECTYYFSNNSFYIEENESVSYFFNHNGKYYGSFFIKNNNVLQMIKTEEISESIFDDYSFIYVLNADDFNINNETLSLKDGMIPTYAKILGISNYLDFSYNVTIANDLVTDFQAVYKDNSNNSFSFQGVITYKDVTVDITEEMIASIK